jgi:hypothetical protein
MTAPIEEIVNVTITRESLNLSQVGFGTIMILSGECNFAERLQYFSTDDAAAFAGALIGGVDAKAYLAYQAIASQNPKVTRVALGHRTSNVIFTENAGTYTAGGITGTVCGHAISVSYTSDKATTMAALATAIEALAEVATCTYAANAITIIPASGFLITAALSLSAITGTMVWLSYTVAETESVTDALNAVQTYQTDWYGFIITSRVEADVLNAAAWAETASMKYFLTASNDVEIVNTTLSSDTGSIAKTFHSNAYLKSAIIYSAVALTQYPDAALFGRILPYDPGSYTACFKSLAGITVDALTATQRANAFEKKVNVYEYVGGTNILREGVASGNEYIDVMIFIDWLDARCTEAVFAVLASSLKVPYTDAGIASIQNALTTPLKTGQNNGGISPDAYDSQKKQIGGFYIIIPKLEDVPTADKTSRTLNSVRFIAYLAGAIQKVVISGLVTV